MSAEGNYIIESDIDNWEDGATEAEKQDVIDSVEQTIERITKDYFYAKAFDIKLNGNNRSRLYIPIRQKILSITAVYIDDTLLAATEYSYDEDSIFASIDSAEIDPIEIADHEYRFPRGRNNINVIGTLGWAECPILIKQACIMLAELENDSDLYETYEFQSENLGEYSYTRGDKSYVGVPVIDKKINLYVNRRAVLATY